MCVEKHHVDFNTWYSHAKKKISSFFIFIFFVLRVENFELNLTQESTNYWFLRELFERRKQIDENNQWEVFKKNNNRMFFHWRTSAKRLWPSNEINRRRITHAWGQKGYFSRINRNWNKTEPAKKYANCDVKRLVVMIIRTPGFHGFCVILIGAHHETWSVFQKLLSRSQLSIKEDITRSDLF